MRRNNLRTRVVAARPTRLAAAAAGPAMVQPLEARTLFSTFTVTTVGDAGAGSLRQAITEANATAGHDVIAFAIGTGAQTIAVASALPALTDTAGATLDGSTQPGFVVGTPAITIDGAAAGENAIGINITGGNTVVSGLAIRGFTDAQVATTDGGGNQILGCVISGAAAGTGAGVRIASPDNRVGGPTDAERNVIGGTSAGVVVAGTGDFTVSGAGDGAIIENNRIGTDATGTTANPNGRCVSIYDYARGVRILNNVLSASTNSAIGLLRCSDLTIEGNFIGTNATGTAALANGSGIFVTDASGSILDNVISGNTNTGIVADSSFTIRGNKIGTDVTGTVALGNGGGGISGEGAFMLIENNVISANGGDGIAFRSSASDSVIRANKIGTGADGTGDLGNGASGISLSDSPSDFTIGGTGVGDGNVIAFNDGPGVSLHVAASNSILGNSIFSNAGIGIDISGPTSEGGHTPNDSDDSGTGVFLVQNFPTLSKVTSTGANSTNIAGSLQSKANGTYRIEFFSDTDADAEGRTFLGSTSVTTNASGAATFDVTVNVGVPAGGFVTATATNADGSTSEFSDAAVAGQTEQDIKVVGKGVNIANGDGVPSDADDTDFGSLPVAGDAQVTRTFTLTNTGQSTLNLTGSPAAVALSGAGASQFTVVTQPAAASIAPGQSSTFEIRFVAASPGVQLATVTIASNDPDESPFTFTIRGIGVAVGEPSDTTAPTGVLRPQENQPQATSGAPAFAFIVRYHDETAMSSASFDNGDVVVTGPNGFSQAATYLPNLVSQVDPQTWDVMYQVAAPGGTVDAGDNGNYTITVAAGQVLDSSGNAVAAGSVGTFALTASDVNTSLGQFGKVNGKRVKLTYAEPDGTQVTVSLNGGSGEVFRVADGRAQINVTSDGKGGKLSVTTKGGNGRAEIRDIGVSGALKGLTAKTADVDGVITATGDLGAISLGSVSGATLSTTGAIKSIAIAGDVTNSQFWSGVRFGDGRFDSVNVVSDTPFLQGAIGKISVGGQVANSLFASGLDPVDDQLFNGNGIIVGGPASVIKAVTVKGNVDADTKFVAGTYPKKASLGGQKIDPLADAHFDMTP